MRRTFYRAEPRFVSASPACKGGFSLIYGQTPPSQAGLVRSPRLDYPQRFFHRPVRAPVVTPLEPVPFTDTAELLFAGTTGG